VTFEWSPLWFCLWVAALATAIGFVPGLWLGRFAARRPSRIAFALFVPATLSGLMPTAITFSYMFASLYFSLRGSRPAWVFGPLGFSGSMAVAEGAICAASLFMIAARAAFPETPDASKRRILGLAPFPASWRILAGASALVLVHLFADMAQLAYVISRTRHPGQPFTVGPQPLPETTVIFLASALGTVSACSGFAVMFIGAVKRPWRFDGGRRSPSTPLLPPPPADAPASCGPTSA